MPSWRVANLAHVSAAVENLRHMYESEPRPFRIAIPALTNFPWVTWRRIVSRAMRRIPLHAHGAGDPAGLRASFEKRSRSTSEPIEAFPALRNKS